MKNCHVCNFECEDNAEICPICGADLTYEPEIQEERLISSPVILATFEDVVSAEIFRDILTENEIPYSSDEDGQSSMKVLFGGSFAADEIYVDKADFEKANELYNEFLKAEPEFEGEFFDEEFEEEQ